MNTVSYRQMLVLSLMEEETVCVILPVRAESRCLLGNVFSRPLALKRVQRTSHQ